MRLSARPCLLAILAASLGLGAACTGTVSECSGCNPDEGDAAIVTPGSDAAATSADAGAADASGPGEDASLPGSDAAEPGRDAGEPGLDAGPPAFDAAAPGLDAAQPPGLDAAQPPGLDAAEPGQDAAEPGLDAGGAAVLFEDDFDQADSIPDTTKWSLCPNGAPVQWAQYLSESYDQAYVSNGKLIVKGEKVGGVYKTGGIWSLGKFDFTYGKLEVNARITEVQGGWPAIWLMPTDMSAGWPSCGEIDLMEQVSYEYLAHHTVHSHYGNDLGHYYDPLRSATSSYDVGQFNTYTMEWTAEAITFSVNGIAALTYPNWHLADEATQLQWPFHKPFFIILNFALGGDWPGPITDSELPGMMEVDWVRVTANP